MKSKNKIRVWRSKEYKKKLGSIAHARELQIYFGLMKCETCGGVQEIIYGEGDFEGAKLQFGYECCQCPENEKWEKEQGHLASNSRKGK